MIQSTTKIDDWQSIRVECRYGDRSFIRFIDMVPSIKLPGSINDRNMLRLSDHFSDVLGGSFPQISPSETVHDKARDWFNYLTNEIHLPGRISIQSQFAASNRKG